MCLGKVRGLPPSRSRYCWRYFEGAARGFSSGGAPDFLHGQATGGRRFTGARVARAAGVIFCE